MTPDEIFDLLGAVFVAFLVAASMWFAWAMVVPRDRFGAIPAGCTIWTYWVETITQDYKRCLAPHP